MPPGFTEDEVLRLRPRLEAERASAGRSDPRGCAERKITAPKVAGLRGLPARRRRGSTALPSRLGNARLSQRGIDVTPLAEPPSAARQKGETVMFLARDGKLAGLSRGRSDQSRERRSHRRAACAWSKIVMATGDNAATAKAVASCSASIVRGR